MATQSYPKCGAEVFATETSCKKCGNTEFGAVAAAAVGTGRMTRNSFGGRVLAVPFVPAITAGGNEAQQSADQLTALIAHYDNEGFEFRHLEGVTTLRNNGCLAFGNTTSVVTVQVAIFERRESPGP